MILYRIAKCNYAGDLSGTGARLYGGRWNSEGKPMLYTASSRALAVLEVLVHLSPLLVPNNFCLVEIEVPENSIYTLTPDLLPQAGAIYRHRYIKPIRRRVFKETRKPGC
jgi:RES domain-containing protein